MTKKSAAKSMASMHAPAIDHDHIIDGIYIGTNQCCQMHFDDLLKNKEGITADISLEKDRLDAPFGIDFYLWLPVKDHSSPSPDQLLLGVSVLQQLVAMGHKVYVHCKNGHGRAPTLVAAYLLLKGYTVKEALDLLKKMRSVIHLQNAQIKALDQFKKHIS
ncbi:MAG: dual specificity protein phosphatase family protein [Candidatus Magasanikbacteria bacterium]|nr:dual specificity protein phosphatase family protein [Candidatus Magasanikbacteria bacterium]